MPIYDMFSVNRMKFDLKSETKEKVLEELISLLAKDGKIDNEEKFKKAVLKREEEFTTGIGMGIAVPHGKSSTVNEASIVFGKSKKGIEYDGMDNELVYLFFLIAVPEASNDVHLRTLSEISRRLMHEEVREKLYEVNTFEEFIKIFK